MPEIAITTEYGTKNKLMKRTGEFNMMNNNFIMTNGTINGMKAFADTVQVSLELYYGNDVKVVVDNVQKNNNVTLTGVTIIKNGCNLNPTIYLEAYYADYKAGTTMAKICRDIMDVLEEQSVLYIFDTSLVTDFNKVRSNVCFKVINAEKNRELLKTVPHKMFLDLAVVFYIEVSQDMEGTGTILVQNYFLDMWNGVDSNTLYRLALANTQRKYRGRVCNMFTVISEVFDEELANQFFEMVVDGDVPMYVASNVQKVWGAGVILYDNLLKTFAERIGGDFYILPSSTHEVLFVPAYVGFDAESLKQMVQNVNATIKSANVTTPQQH